MGTYKTIEASVLMQRLSYPTETVLSNNIIKEYRAGREFTQPRA